MARRRNNGRPQHRFGDKLLLNQWLLSLFGLSPLEGSRPAGQASRTFHQLAEPIKDTRLEGLGPDNLHRFYHALTGSGLFRQEERAVPYALTKEQILPYEENIVRHTRAINEKRQRPVVWKYYQWLNLLFVDIYLRRFFDDREKLLTDLNQYVRSFNARWGSHDAVPPYAEGDLNKICLQNATGSGKTLLMHVNLLQYRHYAEKHGKSGALSRVILLTPNERLSAQHIAELQASDISAGAYLHSRGGLLGQAHGMGRVDTLEITKLAEQDGPNTIATRSLGDQNLLLVDEGHRGMSGKEEGVWFTRRSELCAKGFTFEYSATFEQAVRAAKNEKLENGYAKAVIFDYSYRWFYEDGFGKDYQILNLPQSHAETESAYLTACLLKFYQQLRIYEERAVEFAAFNVEKPLWVFVGSTVSPGKMDKPDEQIVATDVARVVRFIAGFLGNQQAATRRIEEILVGKGQDTGLLDAKGRDIFADAFVYLAKAMNNGETAREMYRDILARLFNGSGGRLSLERIKGASGEVALRAGLSATPFGLINVGDAKGLCDHVDEIAARDNIPLTVVDSEFKEARFASVAESSSEINLLIGSKKFIEGWDCWRVSAMGLMHVGRSEGAQIIQLFGRGVRLKGHAWSLKRSGYSHVLGRPEHIEELETLNVFGIKADYMEKFRDFLKEEGLPGNERRKTIRIPLNVTHDFGKKLKILRPKRKNSDGKEYDFNRDGASPIIGEVPEYLTRNKVVSDWYPRIQAIQSHKTGEAAEKDAVFLGAEHIALMDCDAFFLDLERFKKERGWHNLNITREGIANLLKRHDWYTLYLPESRLRPSSFEGVLFLREVARELLKRYCERYYNYCKREYIEPRLELRELTREDENIPQDEFYRLIVDGSREQVIQAIEQVKRNLEQGKDALLTPGDLKACKFDRHLFQPLLHVRRGGKITVLPVSLNEGEFQFVTDLKEWWQARKADLSKNKTEIYLLRNQGRGKGVGFFEAGGFYPDFILWTVADGKQYIAFIDPHGLGREGPASEKIRFHEQIKDIEQRLEDPTVILNSFILSWTWYSDLSWGKPRPALEDMHVLFMKDDRDRYIDKLFTMLMK